MPKYQCPRCFGSDAYFAQRPQVTGRSIYGDEISLAKVALCRVCAEEMTVFITAEERAKSWSDFKGFVRIFALVSAVIIVVLGGLYIWVDLFY